MLGIFLVIAGVVLAAYLVIKRYYAPWALLMVGILLLICVTLISACDRQKGHAQRGL